MYFYLCQSVLFMFFYYDCFNFIFFLHTIIFVSIALARSIVSVTADLLLIIMLLLFIVSLVVGVRCATLLLVVTF